MRTLVHMSLTASLFGATIAVAQEPTGVDQIEAAPTRAKLAAVPRQDAVAAVAEAGPAGQSPARGNALWARPLDSLRATRDRPVFSESRRPPVVAAEPIPVVAPPPVVTPPDTEPPPLTLVGTVVGPTQTVAIFLNSVARQVVKLRIGEMDSGWTVRSVEPKTTTLEKNSREVTLSLLPPESASDGEKVPGVETWTEPPRGAPGNFQPPRGGPGAQGVPRPFPRRVRGNAPMPGGQRPGQAF